MICSSGGRNPTEGMVPMATQKRMKHQPCGAELRLPVTAESSAINRLPDR